MLHELKRNMGHGSLIQLSAVGVEDVDLKVDANHTFWKTTYAKATGFATEPKEVSFTGGNAAYGARRATVQIIRSGDLIADLYLMFDLGALAGIPAVGDGRFTNDIGRALIESVSVDIGGVIYDTKQSEYLHLWEELSVPADLHCNKLTGKSETTADLFDWAKAPQRIYVPIHFWFTDDYAQSLPLVALYQHDVRIDFAFRTLANLVTGTPAYVPANETGGALSNMVLVVEYVFLENNERNYFARGSHKYMISQLQYLGMQSIVAAQTVQSFTVTFNHPVQELIWVFRTQLNGTTNNEYFDFSGNEAAPFEGDHFLTNVLLLNSSERYAARDPLYFRQVTPKRCHSRIPNKHIYVYSFALHPEQIDPSGSINFSRIDNTQMNFTMTGAGAPITEFHLWARSMNWNKVERGLSKLFYA